MGTTYDEFQYPSFPYPQTHPDRLAVVARIFGMKPSPIDRCRVLELGCAAGGNLIPLADTLPHSEFLGVDLSANQIAEGQKIVDGAGLKNIVLQPANILDLQPGKLGKFDYVICHGVFSWAPAGVQDRILEICRDCLTPAGVAYVSYNTYPGWHMRGMLREIMCFHARKFKDPKRQVSQSRLLLDFLMNSVQSETDPYALLLKRESELLKKLPDSYLLHEHLEDDNAPLYFYQFADRAKTKGLQYLGESEFSTMATHNFKPEVEKTLQRIGPDIIQVEQYMDFLRNRTFRQTLLCRIEAKLVRRVAPDVVRHLQISALLQPENASLDPLANQEESFKNARGAMLRTKSAVAKVAFTRLAERWPESIPFESLAADSQQRLAARGWKGAGASRESAGLATVFLRGFTAAMVELHVSAPPCVRDVSPKPMASRLARCQTSLGANVTTLRHQTARLTEFARQVVHRLDGERTTQEIHDALLELAMKQQLVIQEKGQPVTDRDKISAALSRSLRETLENLGRNAMLMR